MKNSILFLFLAIAFTSCKKEETVTEPTATPNPILETKFSALHNVFDGNGVGAAINLHEDVLILFNMDGDKYVWFEEEEIKAQYDLSDNNGPLSGYNFNSVGAALALTNSSGAKSAYFLDGDGDRYHVASYDHDNIEGSYNNADAFSFSSNDHELYEWGPNNTCPFNSIGAARPFTNYGSDCFDASINNVSLWMINGNGNSYTFYDNQGSGSFYGEDELENWAVENNCGGEDGLLPFDAISACCRYVETTKIQEIFFSEDGTQMCFYTVSQGEFTEIYNLYD